MSILSALHQQHGSIDDLAKLPQAMIMQMAQKKQISEDMVAPILSRKAELMDAAARTKAMQGAGMPQTSVMEQLMAKNAASEAPQQMPKEIHEAGIAQLPVEEPQYAGGGIVAFQNNPDQPVDADMPREGESESDYLKRSRAVQEAGSQFFIPRNYDPTAKLGDLYRAYQENIGKPFSDAVSRFTGESLGSQADKFNAASNARKNISFTNTAPKTEAPAIKTEPVKTELAKTEPASTEPGIKSLTKPAADTKAQSPLQKATGAPEMKGAEPKVDPIDAMLAKYEKLIAGDPEAAKQAKKDAFNQRLLEGGLNVMGGTSPYALTNIGQGAAAAAKGYGEDVKGLRAEETAKLNQLANLGLKGVQLKQEARKLGITEKHYDDWLKVQTQQNSILAGTRSDANQLRADTALQGRIKGLTDSLLKLPKYMDNPELAYADATKMVTGQGGGAPVPTYNPQTRTFK